MVFAYAGEIWNGTGIAPRGRKREKLLGSTSLPKHTVHCTPWRA